MSLYSDTALPVPDSIQSLHADELLSNARPGTWGTAAQRTALASETRRASCEAGLQESIGDEALADSAVIPEAARRVARAVARGGMDINREFFRQALHDGLTDGAYVEAVGVAARTAHLDVFARGIGVASRKLAEPVEESKPTMQRPAIAKDEGFFVPSVPSAPEGGELAKEIYGSAVPTANIHRSLSLVPGEAKSLNTILSTEYFSPETMMDRTYSSLEGLSRPQLELVATRISALNQCFY